MCRKILSVFTACILLFSCATTTFAAESEAAREEHSHSENEALPEYHSHSENEILPEYNDLSETICSCNDSETDCLCGNETECICDGETACLCDGKTDCLCDSKETEQPEEPPIEQEAPGYFLLETRSGISVVVFGNPDELPGPGISPRLVGSRPCVFINCPNMVTVNSKYDYVCNSHKCAVSGCSTPIYQINPNRCQLHLGMTNLICQIDVSGNMCGKPVVSGSLACWDHHCPGCLGPSSGNAAICYYCRQCWVPGCANPSTCTNECDAHCPHSCKTHHQNHCLTCHSDPCICYPVNPAINVRAWNSADNSVAVDISSARAVEIELYTLGGVKFAALAGASGTHIFRYNAAWNNGGYYVRVKSAVGYNSGSFPFQVSALDIAPPSITEKSVQPANEIWTTSKTLTITANDATNTRFSLRYEDGSPVPNCPDKEGGISGSGFAASWTITEQIARARTFRIIAADRWGYSSQTTVSVSGIDNQKPSKPTVSLDENNGWHREDVTVTISGSGADSGINRYEYRVDGGSWRTGGTVSVTGNGIHEVEAKAVSGSGMESDIVSVTVRIDKTKPTARYTLSPEDWTTGDVVIALAPSDEGGSGLASVTLPSNETVYDFASIQFPVFQNGDYRFTVTDSAGNSTVVIVTVGNIAMLDVTVTLNVPFVISPDDDRLYAGGILFQNHSNVPVSLTLQSMTAYGNAPRITGKDDKSWKSLSVRDTKKYIALGFIGNGVDFWLDAQNKDRPHPLGRIDKGGSASYCLQGKFGYAWEEAGTFVYGMAVKVAIAH